MKPKVIPYNNKLNALSKELRQNMTYTEVKLWLELRDRSMMEYHFIRQRPLKNYIVDFYCKELKLAIEIDGITHDDEIPQVKDNIRQGYLEKEGISFLRFAAMEVLRDFDNVRRSIEHWIMDFEDRHGVSEKILKRRNLRR